MNMPRLILFCAPMVAAFLTGCQSGGTASWTKENEMPIGLVLSGGGAKGAYEVGVWQVLEEEGITPRVTAISGTSVGAINAALFATRPEEAETLWTNRIKGVFSLDKKTLGKEALSLIKDFGAGDGTKDRFRRMRNGLMFRAIGKGVSILYLPNKVEGYVDSSRLAKVIADALPKDWPKEAPAVFATAVEKGSNDISATWKLNDETHERRMLMLRASTAIPVAFETIEIDEKTYIDGGWESQGGNNVPLEPILENRPEIKTVVVVYLKDKKHLDEKRLEKNHELADAAGVRIVDIIPSEDIGRRLLGWEGVFDSSPATVRHLIELGRSDARKKLREAGLTKTLLDN